MKTLMIEDLSATKELDGHAMSAVRGGTGFVMPYLPSLPFHYPTSSTSNINVSQANNQLAAVTTNVGNDSAFDGPNLATVTTSQKANNSNSIF
jgi:hypothetical protein